MATRNKRKLAALNKENCEEHPRSKSAQNSDAPRSQEDYITQVSEEIEGRVTKKLSQEFSRTENRILGALARLDSFLMNPLLQGHSGTATETSRNVFSVNQGTSEDDSQSDPHPEAGTFDSQAMRNAGQELCCDKEATKCEKNSKKMNIWHENYYRSPKNDLYFHSNCRNGLVCRSADVTFYPLLVNFSSVNTKHTWKHQKVR